MKLPASCRTPAALASALLLAAGTAASAAPAVVTLRCAAGCSAALNFLTVSAGTEQLGELSVLACSPAAPAEVAAVDLAPGDGDQLAIRFFETACPDAPGGGGACSLAVPAGQKPWGAELLASTPVACQALPAAGQAAGLRQNGGPVAAFLTVNFTPCEAGANTLCIDDLPGDRRFALEVAFETAQAGGRSGMGRATPLAELGTRRGGIFSFVDPTNPEMLVKVLAGCDVNGHYWVFHSEGTNFGFELTVEDTESGLAAAYANPDLTPAPPVQDTRALPCLP